jgi:hypothetical protein
MAKIITKFEPELLHLKLNPDTLEISNCNTKFYIQTPRLRFRKQKTNLQLLLQGKSMEKLNTFYVYLKTIENKLKSLYKSLSGKSLKTNFKLPSKINDPISFNLSESENFDVYDRQENIIMYDKFLKDPHEVTFIIICESIKENQIIWKPVQAMSHSTNKSTPVQTFTRFEIQKEEDDEEPRKKPHSKKHHSKRKKYNSSDDDISVSGPDDDSGDDEEILIQV